MSFQAAVDMVKLAKSLYLLTSSCLCATIRLIGEGTLLPRCITHHGYQQDTRVTLNVCLLPCTPRYCLLNCLVCTTCVPSLPDLTQGLAQRIMGLHPCVTVMTKPQCLSKIPISRPALALLPAPADSSFTASCLDKVLHTNSYQHRHKASRRLTFSPFQSKGQCRHVSMLPSKTPSFCQAYQS